MTAQPTYNFPVGTKRQRISLQVDAEQRSLLEAAADAEHTSVSDFVLSTATIAAANVLADRTTFTPDEEAWAAFNETLNRPAKDSPGLRRLLTEPTVLDQGE